MVPGLLRRALTATSRRTLADLRRLADESRPSQDLEMRESAQIATARRLPVARAEECDLSRFVQPAPGPEGPDTRDRAGIQQGMIIILVGGSAFWLGVAGLVTWLLR